MSAPKVHPLPAAGPDRALVPSVDLRPPPAARRTGTTPDSTTPVSGQLALETLGRLSRRQPGRRVHILLDASNRRQTIDALVERAETTGAAVCLIEGSTAQTLSRHLKTGRSAVLSPQTASALDALSGRRFVLVQVLDELLRQHARHRPVVVIVADRGALDEDGRWLLTQLQDLLCDCAVTWLFAEGAHTGSWTSASWHPSGLGSALPLPRLRLVSRGSAAGSAGTSPSPFSEAVGAPVVSARSVPAGTRRATSGPRAPVSEPSQQVPPLVALEHSLRAKLSGSDAQNRVTARSALRHLEGELDQCRDLLRQGRAPRAVHLDPDDAHARPAAKVGNVPSAGGQR